MPLVGSALPPATGAGHGHGPLQLATVTVTGVEVDTFRVGGFSRGGFVEAVGRLDSGLNPAERTMVGAYLDRIFGRAVGDAGLGSGGRLRVVYERSAAPDGTTRSVRIIGAEAAVTGTVHTAFYHEHDGRGGYYDHFGRSLDAEPWLAPVERSRVSSPFGAARRHPVLGRVLPHRGTDFAAAAGTPVRAAADGSVAVAGVRGGYGNLVELLHPNGYSTRYAHLSGIAGVARQGSPVRQGEVIGYVGSTGLATGPHLHFEVRRRGEAVDPLTALEAGRASVDLGFDAEWRAQRERVRDLVATVRTVSLGDRERSASDL